MQLHIIEHWRIRLGATMRHNHLYLVVIAWIISGCANEDIPQVPHAGTVQTDSGGMVGYQHGLERSRFIVGTNGRPTREFGFIKVVASEGTFAVDAENGAVFAIPNARSVEQQKAVWYTHGADKHNQQVLDYFVAAGVPQDQIGGIHATTSLYTSGGANDSGAAQPTIAGWQSVLQRVINGVPVIDSVVWARMNEQGEVISELVYWPPISAKAIDEARRLRSMLSQESERAAFLSRLPRDLPPGKVVIRHSSATVGGPFEVFASYDVVERRTSIESTKEPDVAGTGRAASIIRHFDIEGNERKLAQERYAPGGADFPAEKHPPPTRKPE